MGAQLLIAARFLSMKCDTALSPTFVYSQRHIAHFCIARQIYILSLSCSFQESSTGARSILPPATIEWITIESTTAITTVEQQQQFVNRSEVAAAPTAAATTLLHNHG